MNTTYNKSITDVLVKHRAGQFAFLQDLVRINSMTHQTGLLKAAEKVAVLLERLGFEVERHAPAKDRIEALGRHPMQNLVVRRKFADGPVLALVSHLDTVEAGAGWTHDPLGGDIRDGLLHGLGALSGKGHLTAQVFAILALAEAEVPLKGTIELHISFDGENGGGLGARWLLSEGLVAPDMAIAGGPAHAVATHSTGTMIIDVEVRGKAAPSHAPAQGHDALEAASHALSRLYQFRSGLKGHVSDIPGLGSPTMVVERISGGKDGAGVPDFVTLHIDRRLLPEENPAQVEKQLTNLIGSTIAKLPGVRCRIRRSALIPAMGNDDTKTAVETAISERLKVKSGKEPVRCGMSFDHEGRHYAANGIPTVMYGAGPVDPIAAGLHGPDEKLQLDDVRLGTEILAQSAIDLLSGD